MLLLLSQKGKGKMAKTKMLRVLMTEEQFKNLSRMAESYHQPTVSEYVRMMANYFDQHRPAVIVQPRMVEKEKLPA